MKKLIILGVVVVALVLISLLYKGKEEKENKLQTIKINNTFLNVEIADTNQEKIKGLSGREGLSEDQGMLFVFEEEGSHGIWMKDMNFNIDIAWIDKNKKIIYIEKDVSPSTYPKVFYGSQKEEPLLSLYVLETKANFFEKVGIGIGDLVEF